MLHKFAFPSKKIFHIFAECDLDQKTGSFLEPPPAGFKKGWRVARMGQQQQKSGDKRR
jgi:hypothetical protein